MSDPDGAERSGPEEEIMHATYEALCEHGYAELTVQRIAEQLGKSTAAIHYHYDTKDELLVAFLRYLLDGIDEWLDREPDADPRRRLEALLDGLLPAEPHDERFTVAMLDMRAQAPHNDAYREQFVERDAYTRELLESAIADGIDEGTFRGREPETVARSLMTVVDGGWTRYVVLDDDDALTAARETAREHVAATLVAER
jgi:AcrR family transcriptional regulator